MSQSPKEPGILAGFTSWRLGAVSLLSLSSGVPLGLVLTAVPAWMTKSGVDIKTVGLITLAQAPYGFKFIWAPLLDRVRPPWLGLRRGWVFLCQLVLAVCTFGLSAMATSPVIGAVTALTLLIAFASASQDIAYDAYSVEVLEKHEHGAAVGARTALYRVGMFLSGALAISLGGWLGWQATLALLALIYVALLPVTFFAPEPTSIPPAPSSLRDAVWKPFVGFLGRPRALELLAFVLLFRLTDSLADALISPFLVQMHYADVDIGVARGTIGVIGNVGGTFAGGLLTQRLGVGRTLWLCALLQPLTNLSYVVIAESPVTPALLYGAIAMETLTTGLTWGAFGVLLLRLTDKRFSATQYALFSSLVGLARTFMGPVAGLMVDGLGWTTFFLLTLPAAIPGMILLQRFSPFGREPKEMSGEPVAALEPGPPHSNGALIGTAFGIAVLGAALSITSSSVLAATKAWRAKEGFDPIAKFFKLVMPARAADSVDLIGALIFGLIFGLAAAAYMKARGRTVRKES